MASKLCVSINGGNENLLYFINCNNYYVTAHLNDLVHSKSCE